MDVIQVVPRIVEEASGPSYSVPALCQALTTAGLEVELHVTRGTKPPASAYRFFAHGEFVWPPALGLSPAMRRELARAATQADVLHNHSLWCMANVYAGWAVRGQRCRLVTSPRGTLSPKALQRSRWRKRAMWRICQAQTMRRSACLHATSEIEYDDIRRLGFTSPVALIPNGVDLPALAAGSPPAAPGRRRLLFLGRIHPHKGVEVLIRAWRRIQAQAPEWELRVVGPDAGSFPRSMRRLARDLGTERVEFHGPVFGPAKSREYLRADLFVLPTRSENFGMTVAEALAHGLPVLVTRGAPWAGLGAHGCGWWIEPGEEALTDCLRQVLGLSRAELRVRGAKGRAWMKKDFSWDRIGERMRDTYHWLVDGGVPPGWVRTS